MRLLLLGFAFGLLYAPSVRAQALTLDQLFWLRSRPEGDNSEYLAIEHGWQFGKEVTNRDSLYYLTTWVFKDAHKKRLAELVYESRGSSNVTSITYSTANKLTFAAIRAGVAAYKMKYAGQKNVKGVLWTYFQYEDAYDVGLAVHTNSKVATPTWYTIFLRPRWR